MINPLCNTIFGTFCDVWCELFATNTRILDVVNYKQPIVCLWLLMANVENRPTATAAQFLPVNIHKNRYLLLSIRLKFFLPQKISFALRDVSFLPELPSMVCCRRFFDPTSENLLKIRHAGSEAGGEGQQSFVYM